MYILDDLIAADVKILTFDWKVSFQKFYNNFIWKCQAYFS